MQGKDYRLRGLSGNIIPWQAFPVAERSVSQGGLHHDIVGRGPFRGGMPEILLKGDLDAIQADSADFHPRILTKDPALGYRSIK